MGRKLCSLVVLVFSLFVFYGRGICLDEDLKAKIEERLKTLKKTISQEQAMLRTLNENLTAENKRLSEENMQLKESLDRLGEERPVSSDRADKGNEETDYAAYLRSQLEIVLAENDKLRSELQQPDGSLSEENARLSEALEDAQAQQSRLVKEIDSLKNQPQQAESVIYQVDPQQAEEVKNLNQQLASLKQQLQERAALDADKDNQIRELNRTIDFIYSKLSEFSQ